MTASACAASTGSLVPCLHPARLPPPALCRDLRAIHLGAGRKGRTEQLRAGKRIAALSLGVCSCDVGKSSGWRAAVWGEGSCEMGLKAWEGGLAAAGAVGRGLRSGEVAPP